MCPLHLDDFLTEIPSRFLFLSFALSEHTQSFRRFYRLPNVSNGVIRARNICPLEGIFSAKLFRIALFGPAAPPRYSWQDFGPSCFFRASSAFEIFEAGLRFLELSFRASSASKIFEAGLRSLELSFGPAAPSRHSRQGFGLSNCLFEPAVPLRYSRQNFGPSNCFFRASSAFKVFEVGL
jgi:hypothetical protein